MASIIPGYEYDIFISYRQKDNKGNSWVTEFVNALKTELESTFKEDISVYFDINPHDGLLETHDVDASLKEKLKCLIFIPIISRTYCDPKSFAWENEFKAFVEQSSKDRYGLKVKLAGGNVANRVLPVMIHDLDAEDKKLVENELGGFIRGIDFIYKEPGINKPLKQDDDEKKNLNKTKYSYQVNKVANAVREIINGLKSESFAVIEQRTKNIETLEQNPPIDQQKPKRDFSRIRLKTSFLAIVTLLIVAIALWLIFFRNNTPAVEKPLEKKISIVVMPFRNMTMDSVWNVWQEGIQTSLITALSNTGEFNVRQVESTSGLIRARGIADYTSLTPSVASSLSVTLDAELFIYGTINKAGRTIRLVAQLINSKSQEINKTFELDISGGEEMIMPMVDSFGQSIADYLFFEKLGRKDLPDIRSNINTKSLEAYKSFINGQNAFYKMDFKTAIGMFSHAAEIDSSFWADIFFISLSYRMLDLNNEAGFWYKKLESKRSYFKGNLVYNNWIDWLKGEIYGFPYEGIKALRQLQKYDNQSPITSYSIGHNYGLLDQYENAIPDLERALELYRKWGIKPAWVYNYRDLILSYHETGQYRKEKELFTPAEKDFPNNPLLIERKILYFITTRDKEAAEKQISRFKTVCMEEGLSEATVISWIGNLLYESKQMKQAEEYFIRALSLDAGNPEVINNYAYFLIDSEKDIKRGLELNSDAIKLDPGNYSILETQGWGLYKLGNYKEAVKYLENSWERKPRYIQQIKNKLDAAQKALTEHQDKL